MKQSSTSSFTKKSHVLTSNSIVDENIKLCPSWFNGPISTYSLPFPDFLEIYDASDMPQSLLEWGAAARIIIDKASNRSDHSGALLFRNLTFITTAAEFTAFWKSCCNHGISLEPAFYEPFGPKREQDDEVDLATNISHEIILNCHNEMVYNPQPCRKIALFCLQDAIEGGESLLAKNSDVTKSISKEIKEFTKNHGGVLYVRKYHDAEKKVTKNAFEGEDRYQKGLSTMSWQARCQTGSNGKAGAISYFLKLGFKKEDIQFDQENNLTVTFIHPGFIIGDDGQEIWYNNVVTGINTAGDGTPYPKELIEEIQRKRWEVTAALKLKPGDWLVCDNQKVQHGRLPYTKQGKPRKLLTVYAK